jgi:hypothetical protein
MDGSFEPANRYRSDSGWSVESSFEKFIEQFEVVHSVTHGRTVTYGNNSPEPIGALGRCHCGLCTFQIPRGSHLGSKM